MTSGGNAGTNKKPQNNAEAFLFFTRVRETLR
jgi:hypothetical protein